MMVLFEPRDMEWNGASMVRKKNDARSLIEQLNKLKEQSNVEIKTLTTDIKADIKEAHLKEKEIRKLITEKNKLYAGIRERIEDRQALADSMDIPITPIPLDITPITDNIEAGDADTVGGGKMDAKTKDEPTTQNNADNLGNDTDNTMSDDQTTEAVVGKPAPDSSNEAMDEDTTTDTDTNDGDTDTATDTDTSTDTDTDIDTNDKADGTAKVEDAVAGDTDDNGVKDASGIKPDGDVSDDIGTAPDDDDTSGDSTTTESSDPREQDEDTDDVDAPAEGVIVEPESSFGDDGDLGNDDDLDFM